MKSSASESGSIGSKGLQGSGLIERFCNQKVSAYLYKCAAHTSRCTHIPFALHTHPIGTAHTSHSHSTQIRFAQHTHPIHTALTQHSHPIRAAHTSHSHSTHILFAQHTHPIRAALTQHHHLHTHILHTMNSSFAACSESFIRCKQ